MRNSILCLLVLFFLASFSRSKSPDLTFHNQPAVDVCSKLDGKIYQYLPSPDLHEHLFTLLFYCRQDSLKGMLFGPDPEGDEGLYFFKSDLDSVTLSGNAISFSFVQKDLYEKPFTLKNYNKASYKNPIVGGSRDRIFYKGTFHADTLTFICTSQNADCYADTMSFVEVRQ